MARRSSSSLGSGRPSRPGRPVRAVRDFVASRDAKPAGASFFAQSRARRAAEDSLRLIDDETLSPQVASRMVARSERRETISNVVSKPRGALARASLAVDSKKEQLRDALGCKRRPSGAPTSRRETHRNRKLKVLKQLSRGSGGSRFIPWC